MTKELPKKSTRGFASMRREKQLEIARKGGKSVPAEKRSFAADPELASKAGREGGKRWTRPSVPFRWTTISPLRRGRKAIKLHTVNRPKNQSIDYTDVVT